MTRPRYPVTLSDGLQHIAEVEMNQGKDEDMGASSLAVKCVDRPSVQCVHANVTSGFLSIKKCIHSFGRV